jgi:uncharacterized protein (TIGR02444 family)
MTSSELNFRNFALSVYRTEGVSPATLLLQDHCEVDVNVLLLAAFLGASRGAVFRNGDLDEAQRRIGRWQNDVVGPLRALRTRLKDGPPPAPTPATADLRERVKAAELDAELIELDELGLFADGLDAPAATGSASQRAAAAMHVVVTDSAARPPTGEERRAISVIATAAAQYSEEDR